MTTTPPRSDPTRTGLPPNTTPEEIKERIAQGLPAYTVRALTGGKAIDNSTVDEIITG